MRWSSAQVVPQEYPLCGNTTVIASNPAKPYEWVDLDSVPKIFSKLVKLNEFVRSKNYMQQKPDLTLQVPASIELLGPVGLVTASSRPNRPSCGRYEIARVRPDTIFSIFD